MDKLKSFFSNIFVINMSVIAVIAAIGLYVTDCTLKKRTCLGCTITVPDFTGLRENEVGKLCSERELQYAITDTGYVKKLPKMTMTDQQPAPLSQVKKGRTIYLTINSDKPPMVKLKDLSQSVERQAMKILENSGFAVNPDSKYEPDPAEGWVLRVEADGKPVAWGTTLPKGTKLTLVLGDGSVSADGLRAADYVGMDYHLCIAALKMHRRILGRVDSTEHSGPLSLAKVYKQEPQPGEKIKPSDPISIWITDPETFKLLVPNEGEDEDNEY